MSNTIDGTFTLQQMLENTYTSKFKTRFEYKTRDVLKKVVLVKETTLHPDRPNSPTVTYVFRSFSYPQYGNYIKGKTGNKQRKYKHQYDQVLSIVADENGQFSMNSRNWKYRLGSQKKWQTNVPQNKVKTIFRETQEKWNKDKFQERERLIKRYSGETLKKKTKELDLKYKKKAEQHKRNAPYLDTGDFNSQVRGINGDAHFRLHPTLQMYGHLYGREPEGLTPNPENVFCPKHMIALIEYLIKINILK